MRRIRIFIGCAAIIICIIGCSSWRETEIKRFPISTLDGIITKSGVELDKKISSDGKGSLRLTVTGPTVIRLFELEITNIENARLIFRAQVRTQNLDGRAYLEMLCHFPDNQVLYSRGRTTPITGTMNWTKEETVFYVAKGVKPDKVKLNLIVKGKGTIWIDDVRLLKGPLRSK